MNALDVHFEDSLVEQSSIQVFPEMDWQTVPNLDKGFGVGGMIDNERKGRGAGPSR